MPLLNSYLRAFFRSALPAQCTPVQDYILLVPTTEILTGTRDRETGSSYTDLAGSDEFLGSHVLRVPNNTVNTQTIVGREIRGKAKQFTTFNGRAVVIKDSYVYSNKGFRNLNQAQILNDTLYYPDVADPQQWLIYFISKPLVGSLEHVSTVPPFLRDRVNSGSQSNSSNHGNSQNRKAVTSFNELLMLFPMIARQMQPGLERMFRDFEVSFERFKPLPLPPPSPSSSRSAASSLSRVSSHSTVNGDVYKQAADESEIRRSLETAITTAIELFQRVDQSQLDLLASTTDLTGLVVDRLIERYVAEQLHDSTLFPRLCATKAVEDEELEQKIKDIENVDLTQVGIPSIDQQEVESLSRRVSRGIASFTKIGTAKSPQAMVEHLLETARTLTKAEINDGSARSVKASSEKPTTTVTMNADMLVSLLLLVVIRARVSNLHARLSYMKNFVFAEDVEQGEVGYVLSTLEAVLFHIAQDQMLSAASRANEKLWRLVKQGNLTAVKLILNKHSGESGVQSDDQALARSTRSEHPVPSNDTSTGTPGSASLINGTNEESLYYTKETQSLRRPSKDIANSVHISEAPPTRIPTGELPGDEERILAEGKEDGLIDAETVWLVKDGPPVEDVWDAPTSPTTGVASVRIEELQPSANEDSDSIRSILLNQPSASQKQATPGSKNGATRFDVKERPSSLRFARTRSIGSIASFASTSDASMSSALFPKSTVDLSANGDAFCIERIAKTRNQVGESILMMAVQERQSGMLQYLIELPLFDRDFILKETRDDQTTLLSAAIQSEDLSLVEALLKVLLKLSDDTLKKYLAIPDSAGRTAAHYLFHAPDLIVRLGQWLPWRAKDKNGQTPLFALCRSYDHSRYKEMVGMAVRQAQITQCDKKKLHLDDHIDSKGNTLLHIAGDHGVVRALLKCDADVNATNDKGFTPLMVASKYGRIELVRALFGDRRVNLLAKELRGLTAVELAKDDDVRNRIDDLVLFQNYPAPDGRVTAVVRSFFVEDLSVRVIMKSGAPATDESATFTVTTCRRSLADFQFLAQWLIFENPASWLPSLAVSRSPYQISARPSRAILRDIQLKVDNFLRTLLTHPTFSTHELLWEFFLVPEMQQESLIERSKKKAEARNERIREEFVPVDDVREVEMFVSFAKDSVRSINFACRSVSRRATVLKTTIADLPEVYKSIIRHLNGFQFMQDTAQMIALRKFTDTVTPNESHPYTLFVEDMQNILSSLTGVTVALERPRQIINEMNAIQKQIDRHLISLRRSDRWPLGILDDTRAKYHQDAAQKAQAKHTAKTNLACELRYTQSVAAQELAAFHDIHTKQARTVIRDLARRQVVVEKDRLESMKRALRVLRAL